MSQSFRRSGIKKPLRVAGEIVSLEDAPAFLNSLIEENKTNSLADTPDLLNNLIEKNKSSSWKKDLLDVVNQKDLYVDYQQNVLVERLEPIDSIQQLSPSSNAPITFDSGSMRRQHSEEVVLTELTVPVYTYDMEESSTGPNNTDTFSASKTCSEFEETWELGHACHPPWLVEGKIEPEVDVEKIESCHTAPIAKKTKLKPKLNLSIPKKPDNNSNICMDINTPTIEKILNLNNNPNKNQIDLLEFVVNDTIGKDADLPMNSYEGDTTKLVPIERPTIDNLNNQESNKRKIPLASNNTTSEDLDPDYVPSGSKKRRIIKTEIEPNHGIKRKRGRPSRTYSLSITPRLPTERRTKRDKTKIGRDEDHSYPSNADKEAFRYRRMRDLNNEASKRCREKRKTKQQNIENELNQIIKRNRHFKFVIKSMEDIVSQLWEKAKQNNLIEEGDIAHPTTFMMPGDIPQDASATVKILVKKGDEVAATAILENIVEHNEAVVEALKTTKKHDEPSGNEEFLIAEATDIEMAAIFDVHNENLTRNIPELMDETWSLKI